MFRLNVPKIVSTVITAFLVLVLWIFVDNILYEDEFVLGLGIILALAFSIYRAVYRIYYDIQPILPKKAIITSIICIVVDVILYVFLRDNVDIEMPILYMITTIAICLISFIGELKKNKLESEQYPVLTLLGEPEITSVDTFKEFHARRVTLEGYIERFESSDDPTGRYIQNVYLYTKNTDKPLSVKCHLIKTCEKQVWEKCSTTGIVDYSEKDDQPVIQLYEVE